MNTKQTTASHTARRSKNYRVWRERLNAVTMQKSHIDAFRTIVCPVANGERSHKASNLTQSEALELMDLARFMWDAGGYLITAEHTPSRVGDGWKALARARATTCRAKVSSCSDGSNG